MNLPSFLEELKRRRVFRVIAVYAVAAWAVIQVSDVILPRLGASDSIVTLVIILAIIGFPVTFVLAWMFDFTAQGVRRTPSAAEQPNALPQTRNRNAVWFAAAIAVALIIGVVVLRSNRNKNGGLNEQLIAVLPFRVSGADPSVRYLREGMVDLLGATLVADDGARAVDPLTVLAHWKKAVSSPDEDLPSDSARSVARGVNAGQVLTGTIVGSALHLTLDVVLTDVTSGKSRRIRAEGNSDSLPHIVDHIAGEILGFASGEGTDRASLLAGVPINAIRTFLTARNAYRAGNYEEAGKGFTSALQQDSTFVLAAIGLYTTHGWLPQDPALVARAQRLAWSRRDALPSSERAIMVAALGPRFPLASSGVELIAAARQAVAAAPDRPESYNWLGEWLFHLGAAVGLDSAHVEAENMFKRTLDFDSLLAAPKEHLAQIAFTRGDTASVNKLAREVLARDSSGLTANEMRALQAMSSTDPARIGRLADHMKNATTEDIYSALFFAQETGLGLKVSDAAARANHAEQGLWVMSYQYELNRGNVSRARQIFATHPSETGIPRINSDRQISQSVMVATLDSTAGAQAVARLNLDMRNDSLSEATRSRAVCSTGIWHASRGEVTELASTIASLQAFKGDSNYIVPACSATLQAVKAVADNDPSADKKLHFADSLVAQVPGVRNIRSSNIHALNMQLAIALEKRGNHAAALRALKRRSFFYGSTQDDYSLNLLMQARINRTLGNTKEAVAAYRHFLALMDNPEPAMRPQVDAARNELATLLGDKR